MVSSLSLIRQSIFEAGNDNVDGQTDRQTLGDVCDTVGEIGGTPPELGCNLSVSFEKK